MSDESRQLTVFRKPKDLMEYLKKSSKTIESALPKHLNPDRMLRLAVTCFSMTPGLQKCTGQSILASIIVASQLGLEPGIAGQGYLIPYKDTCTFVPGWQGLVGLLNNTGRATAWTGAVFEGDEFIYELGSNPKLSHRPGDNYGDPEKLTWVYACGKVNGSEMPIIEAWPMKRVFRHRDRYNKQGNKHYSYSQPEAYGRKVVLLQVLKYLPRSIELANALTAADSEQSGRATRFEDGVVVEVEGTEEPEQARPVIPLQRMGDETVRKEVAVASTATTPAAGAEPEILEEILDEQLPLVISQRMVEFDITDAEMVAWAKRTGLMKSEQKAIAEMSSAKLRKIVTGWADATKQILDARDTSGNEGTAA